MNNLITGPVDAKIAIISMTPDIFHSYGVSSRLDSLLGQAGIFRRHCRVISIMPGTRSKLWTDKKRSEMTAEFNDRYQEALCVLAGMPNLKVIIALDEDVMFVLSDRKQTNINKWAGSITLLTLSDNKTVKMIPTFHPSFALKQWAINPLIAHDLKRAKGEVENNVVLPIRDLIPYPTDDHIIDYFIEYKKHPELPLYTDIECYKGMITRISLAYIPGCAISIPFYNYDTDTVLPNREWIINILRDVLTISPIVGQNFGTFDRYWIKKCWGIECNLVGDTMIAQHVILPGLPPSQKPLSLAMLTHLYTREPYFKDEGKIIAAKKIMPPDEKQGIYSCKDAAVTCEVYQNQQRTPQFRRRKHIYDLEMALVKGPIWYLMQRGIAFDRDKQQQLRSRYKDELDWLNLTINKLAGKAINIRSPKQMAALLYDDLKLAGPKSRSTNAEEIFILAAKYPDEPILNYLKQYRKIDKIFTTILAMKIDNDGRFRCSYSPTTTTGRFKSFENPFGYGCNGQNIVRMDNDPNIRPLFHADPDCYLIEADLEQAELRAVAYFADDERLIALLEDDKTDIHSWMASKILGKEITKKDVAERQLGKRIVHAGNYLISARGLVRSCRIELGINMSETEARSLLKMYFTAFPAIKRWHKQIEQQLRRTGNILTTPLGRERKFFERWGDDLFRKATAFLPQSTIADLLNIIMLKWFNKYNGENNCEILLQLHDAFYTQCPKENIKQHIATLEDAFNHPITINRHEVTIPVGIKVTEVWGGEKVMV